MSLVCAALALGGTLNFAIPGGVQQTPRAGSPSSDAIPPAALPDATPNLATADFATPLGAVAAGSFLSTHESDDVAQQLREMVTGGKPSARQSLLDHVWAFDVVAGHNYQLAVEAWHTPNAEHDDFRFAVSRDDQGYSTLITVSAVADDDLMQVANVPVDVSGTIYVRVEDADQSKGAKLADSVFVDYLAILTDDSTPDVTPPSAPFALTATAGDSQVLLQWSDWGEADLAGGVVSRSTTSGAPWTALNASPETGGEFVDTTAANLTMYYYLVRAVDGAGNSSAPSNNVMAVPHPPGSGAVLMHVSKLGVTAQTVVSGWRQGRADVTIVDDSGAPVAGALVTGAFSGAISQSKSATTGANGVATILSTQALKGSFSFSFCVTSVTHPSKLYFPAQNAATCGSK